MYAPANLIESPGNGLPVEKIPEENSDFDRAVSLSLKVLNLSFFFWEVGASLF
ncbi:hypothetical protein RchiOBHm_Chr3g0481331 [Rosa chinensis]|uniref:Uncharacterized protein n=1 Tax=Rosa chinensis TaxID=74649 RepID=A0A2P6RDY0_ROSCH|nr:hypothetical protein RchiOBHm_Chr3g0481331 [Rosa chinensis]